MTEEKYRRVPILKFHYEEIEKIVAQSTQFQSVADYVNFVLQEMLSGDVESNDSRQAEEVIKLRLRDLGYL
ncbi:MAG: CopG family transcriptional regulator [bacterium]